MLTSHNASLLKTFQVDIKRFEENSPMWLTTNQIMVRLERLAKLTPTIEAARKSDDPLIRADAELCEDYIHTLLSIVEYAVDEIHRPDVDAAASPKRTYAEYYADTESVPKIHESESISHNLTVALDILKSACNARLADVLSENPLVRKAALPVIDMVHEFFANVSEPARLASVEPMNWQYILKRVMLVAILLGSVFSSFALSSGDVVAICVCVASAFNVGLAFMSEIIIWLIRGKSYAKKFAMVLYAIVTLIGVCTSILYCFGSTDIKSRIPSIVTNVLTAIAYGVFAMIKGCGKNQPSTFIKNAAPLLNPLAMSVLSAIVAEKPPSESAVKPPPPPPRSFGDVAKSLAIAAAGAALGSLSSSSSSSA